MTPRALVVVCALAGCASAPLPPDIEARMQSALAADLVAYPELAGRTFALSVLDEHDVFFQSNFVVVSTAPVRLEYAMQANPRAFAAGIDDDMLRGVLGHELAHTLDYHRRTAAQLLELAPKAAFPTETTWERWTDLVAVDRGFGPGLLRYRAWLLARGGVLDDAAIAHKRRVYYGPQELALLMDVKARCPRVFRAFFDAPPTSTREIATHCP